MAGTSLNVMMMMSDGGGGHSYDSIDVVADYETRLNDHLKSCNKEEATRIYNTYKDVPNINLNLYNSLAGTVNNNEINRFNTNFLSLKSLLSGTNSNPFYFGNEPQEYITKLNKLLNDMNAQINGFKNWQIGDVSYSGKIRTYNSHLKYIKDESYYKMTNTTTPQRAPSNSTHTSYSGGGGGGGGTPWVMEQK